MKKLSRKVVLVVEDDRDDAELFRFASRNARHSLEFHFAQDGEEAIAYLKGDGRFRDRKAYPLPDLLLLDLKLPKRDGFEVLDWVRASRQFKDLQVFVWTGWENPEHIARAQEAGAKHFVKPVHLQGLTAMVSNILRVLVPSVNDGSNRRASLDRRALTR